MHIGIDLGGTKIEAIALDEEGRTLSRVRVPTPKGEYDASLAAIVELVHRLEREIGRDGTVGIGIPGTVSPKTGLVKNANSVWLIGQPLDQDIAACLGRPVRCANDANCLAVSEATDGAARGASVVFAAILGTGCGAGIAVDGRAFAGPNGVAGEWGHNPLPWPHDHELPGPACYCGQSGCLETWISGTGLEHDHHRTSGEWLSASEICARADAGDRTAEATLEWYENRLARGLSHVINILDPDVIVLGGGLSNVERLYQSVPRLLSRWVFGGEAETPIRRALHGDASGVRGAAWLWPVQSSDES